MNELKLKLILCYDIFKIKCILNKNLRTEEEIKQFIEIYKETLFEKGKLKIKFENNNETIKSEDENNYEIFILEKDTYEELDVSLKNLFKIMKKKYNKDSFELDFVEPQISCIPNEKILFEELIKGKLK